MKYRDENGQWQDILLPATGDTYPIGSMAPFAGIVVPTNWLKCDGSQYNKSDYPELYKVIGDTWNLEGDNDDTKFRVPDMSERAAIGATNEFPVGTLLGEKEVQLTIDELPSHSHRYERVEGVTNFGGYFGGAAMSADGTLNTTGNGTANTGGNEPHNNIPPSAATMYIIKAKNSAGFLGVVTEDISDENENAVPSAETVKEYVDEKAKPNYIVATVTDAQALSSNYKVTINSTSESYGNFSLTNGSVLIGENIKKVRVSASIFVEGPDQVGYVWSSIRKNNNPVASCITPYAVKGGFLSTPIPPTIIQVNQGDTISLMADSTCNGKLRTGRNNTWLLVEVIE